MATKGKFQRYRIIQTKDQIFDIRTYSSNDCYMYIAFGDKYEDYFMAIHKFISSEEHGDISLISEIHGKLELVVDGVDII